MHAAAFSPVSGISTYDRVSLSGAPPAIEEAFRLGDDLAFVVQPSMDWVTEISAPDQPVDVAVWLTQHVRLEASPADGLNARHFKKDTLLLIPAGMATQWVSSGGMPEAIHLHISPSFRLEWCDDRGLRDLPLAPQFNLPLLQAGASLRRVRAALRAGSAFSRLLMQIAMLEAAHQCLSAQLGQEDRVVSRSMTPGRLRRVREFVEANLAGEISVEDMAACIGLSPAHFSRAFRDEVGVSPYAWVVQARVDWVKEQMLTTRKPLAEIALQCGFASQSHMTETFRRVTGLPPGQWRREADRSAKREWAHDG